MLLMHDLTRSEVRRQRESAVRELGNRIERDLQTLLRGTGNANAITRLEHVQLFFESLHWDDFEVQRF